MMRGLDGDKGGEIEIDAGAIHQCDTPADHAFIFEYLDSSPAGIARQMNLRRQRLDRLIAIALQFAKNFAVFRINHDENFCLLGYYPINVPSEASFWEHFLYRSWHGS